MGVSMTLAEIAIRKEALQKALDELDLIKPSCTNCTKYAHDKCAQFDENPPNSWKIGPVQCEHFCWDGIPF